MNRSGESKTDMTEERPLIRQVEAVPVNVKGKDMILLRDPEALTKKMIMLPPNVFFIVSKFDGRHTLKDIQVEYNRRFGHLIFAEQIRDVMAELDTVLLLENDNYFQYMDFLKEEYKKSMYRDPALAGSGYEDDPEKLRRYIDSFFKGLPESKNSGNLAGIIAPHIDFERGAPTYGKAYNEIRNSDVDLFVIFGTSHQLTKNNFILTKKTFRTPLGEIPTHREFVDKLASNCRTDFFEDEYLHKGEHSIEFQTVMLRWLFPDRNIKIVPILVGSFDDGCRNGIVYPAENPRVAGFIRAFRKTVKEGGYDPFFIAGADFAHVGLSFGDRIKPSLLKMKNLEEDELKSISFIEKMDAESFYADVVKDQDKRRVCGLSPIYTMMKCMNAKSGKLIEYKQCRDPEGIANVTIAAMSLYK
ncbi:MAG: AmmeMemoRadiSam system protein B [Firmicutes bacterium]|nr:AmmeMemoRadiSam system protein B [Bacillota bacterium]